MKNKTENGSPIEGSKGIEDRKYFRMDSSAVSSFLRIRQICEAAPLPLCSLISKGAESESLIEPSCYSRNVELFNIMIFEPATLLVYLVAFVMTAVMIYHIKVKYMAVGRKEVVMFFHSYFLTILVDAFLYTGIIPMGSPVYRYFVFLDLALIAMTLWCFFVSGFTGFQIIEDGTPLSLWSIRISALLVFALTYLVSFATFSDAIVFSSKNPIGPYIILFVLGGPLVLLYSLMQIGLVITRFSDKWPLGDIILGLGFYTIGIVSMFILSDSICHAAGHYVDGIFVGTICNLLAVMMVYKYWDSITKEDLEFSIGSKDNAWELKNPLLPGIESSYPVTTGYE